MKHIVYVDFKSKELEQLLSGKKTMIIRGAPGRKLPYGRVNEEDILYFINNNGEGVIKAKGIVSKVFNSEKMDKETSNKLVQDNQDRLQLTEKQLTKWSGKRYIVLITVENIEEIKLINFDKSKYKNMDDWIILEDIENITK